MQSKPDEDVQGQGKGLGYLDTCELVSPEASEVRKCENRVNLRALSNFNFFSRGSPQP